jgi:hypothetical protein
MPTWIISTLFEDVSKCDHPTTQWLRHYKQLMISSFM